VAKNRTNPMPHLSDWREKGGTKWTVAGIDYYLVPEMYDVLDGVAHSGVIIKGQNREFPRELALQDIFGEGESEILAAEGVG